MIELKKDVNTVLSIPAGNIKKVTVTSRIKGRLKKRNDLIMKTIYQDPKSNIEKYLYFDVEDKYTNIIQKQVLLFRRLLSSAIGLLPNSSTSRYLPIIYLKQSREHLGQS